ncbi:MAG: signal recognition particle-docking protein FtsY [candidate division NC10 bacterium]|nr:signal recognition particle-docking protein FtsY [candidate division NC10 bacterium]
MSEQKGLLERLRRGLRRTQEAFLGPLEDLLGSPRMDSGLLEELEELLITADIGVITSERILEKLRRDLGRKELSDPRRLRDYLREEIASLLGQVASREPPYPTRPWVVLFLGVNGCGKTTTIGKIAWRHRQEGKKVLLAAADTFRAAAIEQLQIWGKKAGADVVSHRPGADPSAVIFDALKAAKARQMDLLLIDTAGRLHTKRNLMEELRKVKRVIGREATEAPHEVLLVLDATMGSNSLTQAREFHQALGVTGLVLAKLDGTAKGGALIGIVDELKIPVKYLGIGEKLDDLEEFEPESFAEALLIP